MKDYKKYFVIPTTPDDIYLALTHEPTLMLWTGDQATMVPEIGAEFSMWDGSIVGKILELEPNKKIVQQWYFGEEEEAPSIVTFKFHVLNDTSTSVELRHTNIPDAEYDDIVDGWINYFFAELYDFYDE